MIPERPKDTEWEIYSYCPIKNLWFIIAQEEVGHWVYFCHCDNLQESNICTDEMFDKCFDINEELNKSQ